MRGPQQHGAARPRGGVLDGGGGPGLSLGARAYTRRAVLWDAVVGHRAVTAALGEAARDGSFPHATLLTGPPEVGKTTLAEAAAEELLNASSWPGGVAAHPDHWLEDSPAARISLDWLRLNPQGPDPRDPTMLQFFSRQAYAGGARVAVIGRADRMSEEAANCLLKCLEEPGPRSHIILCAAYPERMPATVLSRCRHYALAPMPAAELASWLQRVHAVEPDRAMVAATLSAGRPGRALALATDPGALRLALESIDALLRAAGAAASPRLAALSAAGDLAPPNTAEGRERALGQVAAWTGFVRDAACVAAGADELLVWQPYAAAAHAWAQTLGAPRLTELLRRLMETTDQLAQYASPRLTYEVLFLDLLAREPAPPRVDPPDHADLGPAGASTRASATTSRRPARRR